MASEHAGALAATKLVDAFFAAYDRHDVEALSDVYAAEAIHREAALGRTTTGRVEILRGLENLIAAFPDASWSDRRQLVTPTAAAISYRFEGTLALPMAGVPPVGQRVSLPGLMVLEIKAGAVTASSDHWDVGAFLEQLRRTDAS